MKLNISIDTYTDFTCPHCGTSLEVESTYEENMSDCHGIAWCPNCNRALTISNTLTFIAEIRSGKENDEECDQM